MDRITIYMNGPTKKVTFNPALVVSWSNPTLTLKRATIFWDYNNVGPGNNSIALNGIKMQLEAGYFTYDNLKNYLKRLGMTLREYPWTGKVQLSCPSSKLELYKMGELLGFQENQVFSGTTGYIGERPVDMNNGLRFVNISCDLVDSSENLYSGVRSNVITSLPVGLIEKGKVQTYQDVESVVSITRGTFNEMRLDVTDQDGNPVDIGSILLEMYICRD